MFWTARVCLCSGQGLHNEFRMVTLEEKKEEKWLHLHKVCTLYFFRGSHCNPHELQQARTVNEVGGKGGFRTMQRFNMALSSTAEDLNFLGGY